MYLPVYICETRHIYILGSRFNLKRQWPLKIQSKNIYINIKYASLLVIVAIKNNLMNNLLSCMRKLNNNNNINNNNNNNFAGNEKNKNKIALKHNREKKKLIKK